MKHGASGGSGNDSFSAQSALAELELYVVQTGWVLLTSGYFKHSPVTPLPPCFKMFRNSRTKAG